MADSGPGPSSSTNRFSSFLQENIQKLGLPLSTLEDELSTRSGVSIAAISKIEKGQSKSSFETLLRIARCPQMNFVEVMEGATPTSSVTARLIATRSAEAELFTTDYCDYRVHSSALTRKVMVQLRMTVRNRAPPAQDD